LSQNCYNDQPLSKHDSYLIISVSLSLFRTTNLLKASIDCMIEYYVDSKKKQITNKRARQIQQKIYDKREIIGRINTFTHMHTYTLSKAIADSQQETN